MPANPLIQRRINDSVAGDQLSAQIMVSATGDVLSTWFSPGRRARVLDDDGDPVSADIALPTVTSTAAWIDPDEFAILSDNGGVSIQRYDRAGAAVGGPIAVATAGTVDDLALLASGDVVATYRVGNEIRGRILDSTLSPAGAEFLIYDVGTRRVDETIVTPLTGGGFAFTVDFGSLGLGTPLERIALFDGSGNKTASIAPGLIEKPDVDALPDGGFMLASGSQNGDILFYNADGTLRAQSTVNTVGANLDVTLLGTEIVLLTYERTVSGDFQHYYALYNLDGFRLVLDQPLSLSDGRNFDVDATGATSFVSVEHDDLGDPGGSGIDTVVTYWEIDNIVFGTAGADVLSGLGPDRILVGREGNDLFFIDSQDDAILERANQGDADRVATSVDYVMPEGLTVEILSTGDNLGTAPIDLTGNSFAQYIYGNAGANVLIGSLSQFNVQADVMTGFEGDDFYVVNAADQVREAASEGIDEVTARTSWVMTAGQHIELLKTTDQLLTTAIEFTGNEFSQYIYGNNGHNVLRAGGGGDVMTGFEGNDTYYVAHENDQVREEQYPMLNAQDRVIASVSWVLGAGQEVEFIETIDAAAATPIYLVANELDGQSVTGNAGNNTLDGGGGQQDVMIGLGGDDTYIVREAGDHIQEAVGGGFDRVMALTSYTLPGAEIEILATIDPLATNAIDLTGNGLAQYIYGNAGVNRLNGGGGGDVLTGFGGDDIYDIVSAADEVRETAGGGVDRVFAHVNYTLNANAAVDILSTTDNLGTAAINISGNELAQYVYGNAGSNTLGGGAGKDVLTGLGGSDFFLFDSALNTGFTSSFATLGESANVDRIDGFGVDDKIQLKGSLFGLTPGALPAGAFNTGTTATDADDRVLYDSASGALLFDSDGSGAAAAQLIAFISNPFNLDANFIVVV